ncbi:hypothetical protein KA005_28965, partial [bacterium]|nr:hypothetical protein [bacterium]
MKYRSGFLSDEYARIPFSVIGVFLILGSSFTTVYITKLEQEKSLEISSTLDFNEVEHLISYVEADISRGLNYAGMQALKYIGKHPVTFSDLGTAVAFDYADSNGDGIADVAGDNGHIVDSDEAVLFNMNWAKNITRMKLNEYLESNFMNDRWRQRDILINIKVSDEEYPVEGWREITFQPVEMELKRTADLNLLITEDRNEDNKAMYDTYWMASVDLEITVKDLSSGATWDFLIHPNCIVTSRL